MTDNDNTQEYLEKIRKTVSQSKELIARAREKIAETDRIYADNGWTREEVQNFLSDPNLPPELRKKLNQADEQWQEELKRMEQEQALQNEAGRSPEERQQYQNEKFSMLRHTYRL